MKLITIIEFKSNTAVYCKEKNGIKNNTVRIVSKEEDEILEDILYNIKYIKIVSNVKYSNGFVNSFIRIIKDITRYEQDNIIIYIFTWKV